MNKYFFALCIATLFCFNKAGASEADECLEGGALPVGAQVQARDREAARGEAEPRGEVSRRGPEADAGEDRQRTATTTTLDSLPPFLFPLFPIFSKRRQLTRSEPKEAMK